MDSQAKGNAKFQKKIDNHVAMIAALQKALDRRNIYRATANAFMRKLLKENRVTKEELREYFKPMKEFEDLKELE